ELQPRTEASEDAKEGPAVLPPAVPQAFALRMAMSLSATLFRLEAESSGGFEVVRDVAQLRRGLDNATVAAILHFEGAEPIQPELNAPGGFYRAGLPSLGLAWQP